MRIKISDENFSRVLRALNTKGNLSHARADEHHQTGNFGLRDDFRSEGDAFYALGRDLNEQKGDN